MNEDKRKRTLSEVSETVETMKRMTSLYSEASEESLSIRADMESKRYQRANGSVLADLYSVREKAGI
jgi:hypothetical protein